MANESELIRSCATLYVSFALESFFTVIMGIIFSYLLLLITNKGRLQKPGAAMGKMVWKTIKGFWGEIYREVSKWPDMKAAPIEARLALCRKANQGICAFTVLVAVLTLTRWAHFNNVNGFRYLGYCVTCPPKQAELILLIAPTIPCYRVVIVFTVVVTAAMLMTSITATWRISWRQEIGRLYQALPHCRGDMACFPIVVVDLFRRCISSQGHKVECRGLLILERDLQRLLHPAHALRLRLAPEQEAPRGGHRHGQAAEHPERLHLRRPPRAGGGRRLPSSPSSAPSTTRPRTGTWPGRAWSRHSEPTSSDLLDNYASIFDIMVDDKADENTIVSLQPTETPSRHTSVGGHTALEPMGDLGSPSRPVVGQKVTTADGVTGRVMKISADEVQLALPGGAKQAARVEDLLKVVVGLTCIEGPEIAAWAQGRAPGVGKVYCACGVEGKHGSTARTPLCHVRGDTVRMNGHLDIFGFEAHDTLTFTVFGHDEAEPKDVILAEAKLPGSAFQEDGFENMLPLTYGGQASESKIGLMVFVFGQQQPAAAGQGQG